MHPVSRRCISIRHVIHTRSDVIHPISDIIHSISHACIPFAAPKGVHVCMHACVYVRGAQGRRARGSRGGRWRSGGRRGGEAEGEGAEGEVEAGTRE